MQQFSYIAAIFVLGGIASAAVIAVDLRTCRQPMPVMRSVWILTGLWASFFGLWAYFAFGRTRRCLLDEKSVTDNTACKDSEGTDGTGGWPATAGNGKAATAAHTAHAHADIHPAERDGRSGMEPQERREMQMPDTSRSMPAERLGKAEMEVPRMERPDMPADTHPADRDDRSGMQTPETQMPGTEMEGVQRPDPNGSEITTPGRRNRTAINTAGMAMPGINRSGMQMPGTDMSGMDMPVRPKWQSVVLSTLHCGAGCTLADLLGEWFLYFVPIAIGGSLIAGAWVLDYILALIFGIGFQYAAIRGMEPQMPHAQIVRRAAKADILSLTAWQAGMYAWMAVVIFALRGGVPLPRTSFAFWFMMQIAMACGFLVALPVNILLIRAGIKKGM